MLHREDIGRLFRTLNHDVTGLFSTNSGSKSSFEHVASFFQLSVNLVYVTNQPKLWRKCVYFLNFLRLYDFSMFNRIFIFVLGPLHQFVTTTMDIEICNS